MPLDAPNLDDRNFAQLMAEALQQIKTNLNVDWSDLSPGDPGVVLLEAFAYLTEQMIYRLNRLPRKSYITFLRLLGISLQPPTAAKVELVFRRSQASATPTLLDAGTPVTMTTANNGQETPVFVTERTVELPAGEVGVAVKVLAYHCELVAGELLGKGTGQPGLAFPVQRPPIVARLGNHLDLAVGVELAANENAPSSEVRITPDGKRFRIWQEVANFANLAADSQVYLVDRMTGLIQFAPAARLNAPTSAVDPQLTPEVLGLAAIPLVGREIRVWYPRGGGPTGNVPANTLQQIVPVPNRTPLTGIEVTNPARAKGGMPAETLENALVRGPLELYALERAVTARDFEWVVLSRSRSLITRAKAYTKAEQWRHAEPGAVQIVIVPAPTVNQPLPGATAVAPDELADLYAGEDEALQADVQHVLSEKTPLGIRNELIWAQYKKVWVQADVVINGNEAPQLVKARLEQSLQQLITPFPTATTAGWPFSQQLRVADIYRYLLACEPSISLISSLDLWVEHAPDRAIHTLAADYFQAQTWYVGSGGRLFRSLDDGQGWELLQPWQATGNSPDTAGEEVVIVRPSPDRAGLVAVATHKKSAQGEMRSPLYVSVDCGETWCTIYSDFDSQIEDMAWVQRTTHYILLLATNKGLFETEIPVQRLSQAKPGRALEGIPSPTLVRVAPDNQNLPLYAVTVIKGKQGNIRVAVAAQARRGVYLSNSGDLTTVSDDNSTAFTLLGLKGEDVRHLTVQYIQERTFLWAGAMAIADSGKGAYCWQFTGLQPPRVGGRWLNEQWNGGSCYALAFLGMRVLAVSAWGGVLTLDFDPENLERPGVWRAIEREELPRRRTELEAQGQERNLFLPLFTIATNQDAPKTATTPAIVMVGGDTGVYRSQDAGAHYVNASRTSFTQLKDAITLPYNWLFISGPHAITVTSAGAGATRPPSNVANPGTGGSNATR